MSWRPTGERYGSEEGTVVRDEVSPAGAQITLEENCRQGRIPFAITCGLSGWFFHTRFFDQRETAEAEYSAMRAGLAELAAQQPADPEQGLPAFSAAIRAFVQRFP